MQRAHAKDDGRPTRRRGRKPKFAKCRVVEAVSDRTWRVSKGNVPVLQTFLTRDSTTRKAKRRALEGLKAHIAKGRLIVYPDDGRPSEGVQEQAVSSRMDNGSSSVEESDIEEDGAAFHPPDGMVFSIPGQSPQYSPDDERFAPPRKRSKRLADKPATGASPSGRSTPELGFSTEESETEESETEDPSGISPTPLPVGPNLEHWPHEGVPSHPPTINNSTNVHQEEAGRPACPPACTAEHGASPSRVDSELIGEEAQRAVATPQPTQDDLVDGLGVLVRWGSEQRRIVDQIDLLRHDRDEVLEQRERIITAKEMVEQFASQVQSQTKIAQVAKDNLKALEEQILKQKKRRDDATEMATRLSATMQQLRKKLNQAEKEHKTRVEGISRRQSELQHQLGIGETASD